MKIAVMIARILLGAIFVLFGLNGFLHFIPMGPMPTGLAGQFLAVFVQSHWVLVVSAVQLVGGVLLLVNRYVPLALTILGPVVVNILCYHALITSMGAPFAIFATLLWLVVFYWNRQYFSGIFAQKTS